MAAAIEARVTCNIDSEKKAVQYLQSKEIIPSSKNCANCLFPMTIQFRNVDDKVQWACSRRTCRSSVTVRKGTWLFGSKIKLRKIVFFITSWAQSLTSIKFAAENIEISMHTTIDFNNYMREVCAHSLTKNTNAAIGGYGKHVEIDESIFTRRKYNRGRVLPQAWVFGGICRETNDMFMVQVDQRNKDTLETEIKKNILPGTLIISDEWRAYSGITAIEGYDYKHETVNHSKNFLNSRGYGTQTMECHWGVWKSYNKKRNGTHRHTIDSYIAEYIWRNRNANRNILDAMYEDIKTFQEDLLFTNELCN